MMRLANKWRRRGQGNAGQARLLLTALVIVLVSAALGAAPEVQAQTNWYVNASTGNDANDCLTPVTACLTIQATINKASAGDIVSVAAGTYTEQVVISKSLGLIGASAASTTIQAPGSLALETDGDGKSIVEITGASTTTTMAGFTVQGALGSITTAIHVHGGATALIANNVVQGTDALSGTVIGHGITVGTSLDGDSDTPGSATITNNRLTGFHRAGIVVIEVGNSATISDNIVTGAGPTSLTTQQGITIQDGATGSILRNTVRNVAFTGAAPLTAVGIFLWDSADSISVTQNTVQDSQTGIMLQAAVGIQISFNTITVSSAAHSAMNPANPEKGIWLTGRGAASLSCVGGDGSTPGLGCSTEATISDNTLEGGGGGTGIVVGGSPGFTPAPSSATITGNTITGWTGATGIKVGPNSGDSATILENNIFGNIIGVENTTPTTLNLENNWWGCEGGPENTGCDSVSGPADFVPWRTEPVPQKAPVGGEILTVDPAQLLIPWLVPGLAVLMLVGLALTIRKRIRAISL